MALGARCPRLNWRLGISYFDYTVWPRIDAVTALCFSVPKPEDDPFRGEQRNGQKGLSGMFLCDKL